MNNKKKGFLLVLSIILILTSCSNSEKDKLDNEYKKLTDTELAYIEDYPTDKIIKELENKIQASILEVGNIELKELNIYEDKLLMSSNENKKKFANIFINIYLKLNKSLNF